MLKLAYISVAMPLPDYGNETVARYPNTWKQMYLRRREAEIWGIHTSMKGRDFLSYIWYIFRAEIQMFTIQIQIISDSECADESNY